MDKEETLRLVSLARELGCVEEELDRTIKAVYIEARDAGINPNRLDRARALGRGDFRRAEKLREEAR